jgi:hypothetical protein
VGSTEAARTTSDAEGRCSWERFAASQRGRNSDAGEPGPRHVLGNTTLSAFDSEQASDEAVDGRRPVPVRYIPLANAVREYAMSPVGAALPIVVAASVIAIAADGHTVGSALR